MCDAGPNPDAGVYPITVSGGDAANYELEYVDGVLIIDKAPLTVSAESFEITYGEPLPEFMVSYDGFVNGEDETVLSTVRMRLCFQACLRQCAMPVPIPMQAYIP